MSFKEQSRRYKLRIFEIITLNTKEKTVNPGKTCVRSCPRENILRTRNCRKITS